jgi:class 3 adenylate cyclase/tetratricopeptide (TPR) repeat protein
MAHKLTPHLSRWLLQRIVDPSAPVSPGQTYRFEAAVLLADMVGSTLLSESLATYGPRGIDRLNRTLNAIFGPVVNAVDQFGGDVSHFTGDAVTCMWPIHEMAGQPSPRQAVLQACSAGLEAQSILQHMDTVKTATGPQSPAMRLGLSYGQVEVTILGNTTHQKWVLAGPAVRAAIHAEAMAPPNRLCLHPSAIKKVEDGVTTSPDGVLMELHVPVSPSPLRPPPVDDEALHPFIHPVLLSRELAGPEEFVAEFRPVAPMFIGCAPTTSSRSLSTWVNDWAQAVLLDIGRFGGWLSNVDVRDREIVILAQFGAPVAHEDDERRAVACALALRENMAALFPNLQLRIGITRGRLFAGTIGSSQRHDYTLIGDEINLASRLMEMAEPGQVIVSQQVRDATDEEVHFDDLGSVHVRGKNEVVPVYAVLGQHHREEGIVGQYLTQSEMPIGRGRELDAAMSVAERAQASDTQVLVVSGEAGIGKSYLVAEVLRRWVAHGGMATAGACLSFARETPYLPWRWIIATCCGLVSGMDREMQLEEMAHTLARLTPPESDPFYWSFRLPLLAEVLGMDVPDNDLTLSLRGQVRRDNTFATIQAVLESRAAQSPLLVLIEDAHWADNLSLQLVTQAAQELHHQRLLFILVRRPLPRPRPQPWEKIRHLPNYSSIPLSELTPQASRALVGTCLGGAAVPDELAEMIFERTHGHPFFATELVRMFQGIGCIRYEEGSFVFNQKRADLLRFPDTVEGVIRARVDQLDEGNRLTLKVASVIGQSFPYNVLAGVYPTEIEHTQLRAHLDILEKLGLTTLEQTMPELEYVFKHSITRDVVYESLAFAQRLQLHAEVAQWYEEQYAGNLEPYYALLAYHYGQAEQREHELHYLLLAADHATRAHAMTEAVRHYERALELLDGVQEPARTASVLMRRGRALYFIGRYERARESFQQARALYEQAEQRVRAAEACFEIADRVNAHDVEAALQYTLRGLDHVRDHPGAQRQVIAGYAGLAQLYHNLGNYEDAHQAIQHALDLARTSNDLDGLWRCYRTLSLQHHSRGERRKAFEAGAETVKYVNQADPPIEHRILALNNQACFALDVGDLDAAIQAGQDGLALARRTGVTSEQVILASSLTGIYSHMGDWDAAEKVLEEGLSILAQHPHPYDEVALHLEAGNLAYGRRDWDKAIEYWTMAEKKSRTGTQQLFTAELCTRLAMALTHKGRLDEAETWIARGHTLARERRQRGALTLNWCAQGMLERERSAWGLAEIAFQQALEMAYELNDPVQAAHILLEHGRTLCRAGQKKDAELLLHQAQHAANAIHLYPVVQAADQLLEELEE